MNSVERTRILFLAASSAPAAQLSVGREYQAIYSRLHAAKHGDVFSVQPQFEVRANQLPTLIMRFEPHVLHFVGHGSGAGLVFEGHDGLSVVADPHVIASVFGVLKGSVRCVVLSACYSEEQARLIATHVDTVIGMTGALPDTGAVEFAGGFYEGLGFGKSVGKALELGQYALGLTQPDAHVMPMLHVRPGVDANKVFLHGREPSQPSERERQWLEDQLAQVNDALEQQIIAGDDPTATQDLKNALTRRLRSGLPLAVGDVLAERYKLIEEAGAGSFGTVWKAYDREQTQNVAVKVLHGQWMNDQSRVKRFISGSKRMNKLDHRAIVKVTEIAKKDKGSHHLFFVMQWFAGGNLDRAVREGGMSVDAALTVIANVLQGLVYAHDHGIVHRDVKPANILLDARGRGALTDFDLAHARDSTHGTDKGMGTFGYAAPEQLGDASTVDYRADVYAAGMCICFALAGEHPHPFLAANPKALEDLDCTPQFRSVLKRATAYKREDRTATCLELISAINDELDRRRSGRGHGPRRTASDVERPTWATASGSDVYGPWANLQVGAVVQRMRWIAPGTFSMGSPDAEPGRFDIEGPLHPVTITRGFWMADTPCTQALWEAVMGSNPSLFVSERRPVEQVSWDDLRKFLTRLETLVRNSNPALPTEAEWEYACRAGTTDATFEGPLHIRGTNDAQVLDDIAWYAGNSGVDWDLERGWDSSKWEQTQHSHVRSGTRSTGLKRPNPWGLHDMLGNVWEWCEDGMRSYTSDPSHAPLGPTEPGTHRMRRGGSWISDARRVRAAFRYACHPDFRYADLGFRFICTGR